MFSLGRRLSPERADRSVLLGQLGATGGGGGLPRSGSRLCPSRSGSAGGVPFLVGVARSLARVLEVNHGQEGGIFYSSPWRQLTSSRQWWYARPESRLWPKSARSLSWDGGCMRSLKISALLGSSSGRAHDERACEVSGGVGGHAELIGFLARADKIPMRFLKRSICQRQEKDWTGTSTGLSDRA